MQKVYFRADAGYGIGYGHFIRSLALADILKEDYECTFFTVSPTEYQVGEMSNVCRHVDLKEETKLEDFLSFLKGDEIVILDNYFFTTEYQMQVKAKGCKLVCIDDMHDKHYVSDAVINHTPGTLPSYFSKEDYTNLYLGSEYLLFRKQFREATHHYTSFKDNNNVYVCFGGSDELNFTRKVCEIIMRYAPSHIDVVVGGAYEFYDDLLSYAHGRDICVYKNATPELIVRLLRNARLAVVPDSMVFFEVCCLRRPVISGYDCDNQKFVSRYNQIHHLGCDIGDLLEDFEGKFIKAYKDMNITAAVNYVYNQTCVIKDTTNNLMNIFKTI